MDEKNKPAEIKGNLLSEKDLENVTGGILDSGTLHDVNEAGFMEEN